MITNRTLLFIIASVLMYLAAKVTDNGTGSEEPQIWLAVAVIFAVATLLNLIADYQKWRFFSRARKMRRKRK